MYLLSKTTCQKGGLSFFLSLRVAFAFYNSATSSAPGHTTTVAVCRGCMLAGGLIPWGTSTPQETRLQGRTAFRATQQSRQFSLRDAPPVSSCPPSVRHLILQGKTFGRKEDPRMACLSSEMPGTV